MNTIYRFERLQGRSYFGTEEEAKNFIISNLKYHDALFEEYKIKDFKIRLDLVVKFDDLYLPVEVKRKLYEASHVAAAIAQAHSYAEIIKRPVFIGPIIHDQRSNVFANQISFAKVIAARMNVGFVEYYKYDNSFEFNLGLSGSTSGSVISINQYGQFRKNEKRFIYRTAKGSKFEANRIIT